MKLLSDKFNIALQKIPEEQDMQRMISEHSFVFFMRQIILELDKLQNIVRKVSVLNAV
jgi:hypothetical protein